MFKILPQLTNVNEIAYSGDWTDITFVVAPFAMEKFSDDHAIAFMTAKGMVINKNVLHEPLKKWMDQLIAECNGIHDNIDKLVEIKKRLDDGVAGVQFMAANLQHCWV